MNKPNFISGMMMYTISSDDLRTAVREGIIEKFGNLPLDQSTYVIHCAAENSNEIKNQLQDICKKAKFDSGADFSKDDFITFYRATNSNYPDEQRDRIERIAIVGK